MSGREKGGTGAFVEYSVANRPRFRPQNAKVDPGKSQRPRKSAAEFSADLPKNGRTGVDQPGSVAKWPDLQKNPFTDPFHFLRDWESLW
jgi:hypothetical protein